MFEQSANLAAVFYTVSAVLFILALRGLSSPESSRRGNMFGMIGIAIAIATTVWVAGLGGKALLLAGGGLAIGGILGALIAKKIPMTDMPQLVAAFHSLVGLAAVLVAVAAFFSPLASWNSPSVQALARLHSLARLLLLPSSMGICRAHRLCFPRVI